MADIPTRSTAQLPVTQTINGNELFVIQQNGITKSAILGLITQFFGYTLTFGTLAALKAYSPLTVQNNSLIYLKGRDATNDGSEGFFILTNVSPGSSDNGINILLTVGGWWAIRQGVTSEIDPSWFGLGSTSVSDQTACQEAINYAQTNLASARGANIVLPGIDINVDQLLITRSQINLIGQYGRTQIKANNASLSPVKIDASTSIIYANRIQDITFDSSVTMGVSVALLEMQGVGQPTLENVIFTSGVSTTGMGASFTRCSQLLINNLQVNGVRGTGAYFENCSDIYLNHSRFDNTLGYGVDINSSEGIYSSNNACYGNTLGAWRIRKDSTNYTGNLFFSNTIGDFSGATNWSFKDAEKVRITNGWASFQGVSVANAHGFTFTSCKDVEMHNTLGSFNMGEGVVTTNTTNLKIIGGSYTDNGRHPSTTYRTGIRANDGTDGLTIQGATFGNLYPDVSAQNYGWHFGDISNFNLEGNTFQNTTLADVVWATTSLGGNNFEGNSITTRGYNVSAETFVTVPLGPRANIATGTNGVFLVLPTWKGREIDFTMQTSSAFNGPGAGGAFQLPVATNLAPNPNGTIGFVHNGVSWLTKYYSVNDNA